MAETCFSVVPAIHTPQLVIDSRLGRLFALVCTTVILFWVGKHIAQLERKHGKGVAMLAWLLVVAMGLMVSIWWIFPSDQYLNMEDDSLDCKSIAKLPRLASISHGHTWSEVYLSKWQNVLIVLKVKRTTPKLKWQSVQSDSGNANDKPHCTKEIYLRNEGRIASIFIGNPHVVQMVGYCEAIPAIVYEYYPSTLMRVLFDSSICPGSQWSLKAVVSLSIGVVQSVEALHTALWGPVVHGEINPTQFVLDAAGRIRIADFHHSTHPTMGLIEDCNEKIGGRYISPEQVEDKKATTASDIYSMGLVIWSIYVRQYAFEGSTTSEVWDAVLKNERPIIPQDMPLPLATIIQDCWKQNPADRSDIATIRQRLERYPIDLV